MGFKRAQGNAHCAKFERNTNRMTFETKAISTTSGIQALRRNIEVQAHNVTKLKTQFHLCIIVKK